MCVHTFFSNSDEYSNVCVSMGSHSVLSGFTLFNQLLAPGVCRGGNSLSFRQTSWCDLWPEINLLFPLLGVIKYTWLVFERAGPGSQSNASFFPVKRSYCVLCARLRRTLCLYLWHVPGVSFCTFPILLDSSHNCASLRKTGILFRARLTMDAK